ncbi:2-amino-4-hydroxy-6-hydroxymethyldihydropteridine diphosphokinase [Pedobacter mucosus]|uniref:2-amino-4-hydroxy-6- hydroxymethyldihydropteridine diphosphokinase n=1 Tax=Pedobacter mucosus TaxID=2895286 RepID=UPI001EE4D267|nr:2-amino-4-hydroxy-6-hydroxymethyldihydropteridine diphosphokinase [Pedobacter mucosus]UKT66103.1 2-amino-4-hydroxy-6-hydroxymethyldihydropteridine diphosphokinase [Pedobacter mucosus]
MSLEYTIAYLLLGGNLGDRNANLKRAISLLTEEVGELVAISSVYETAAWGKTDQPSFLNQAISIKTLLSAEQVLEKALNIENVLGRIRNEKWGERIIDIDIILFGSKIINDEGRLQIPHPHMQLRNFVLIPLAEIAPNIVHPVLGKTILEILEDISDYSTVNKL